jgi:hypothetical protein
MRHKNTSLLLILFTLSSLLYVGCKDKTADATEPQPINNGPSSLLADAQKGVAYTGTVNDFTLAYTNNTVVLLVAQNSTGKIIAIDLEDNDASKAAANTVTTTAAAFSTTIAAKLGIGLNSLGYVNMEVNPISKSVYALVRNTQTNAQSIFKITDGGNTIELLDVKNVNYSTITFSTTGHLINDMTWGDNTLYFSFSNAATLNGEVAAVTAPFNHNAVATSRATTVYKTNWGGNYFTDAPLEVMTYAEVDGVKRLMGVTVCAPGYSFKTTDIAAGNGLLQVKEYFNLNTGVPIKVFTTTNNGNTYLYELHEDGRIARIGKKYLNESLAPSVNARWIMSFVNGGLAPAAGLTDEEIKIISPAGNFIMAARLNDNVLLAIDRTGRLTTINL